jgi:hypothetical protein
MDNLMSKEMNVIIFFRVQELIKSDDCFYYDNHTLLMINYIFKLVILLLSIFN